MTPVMSKLHDLLYDHKSLDKLYIVVSDYRVQYSSWLDQLLIGDMPYIIAVGSFSGETWLGSALKYELTETLRLKRKSRKTKV